MAYPVMAYPAFAATGVRIVVPARDIGRGETIADSDLTYQIVAPENVLSNTATSMDALVGMQTRRVLHQGESVRNDDVRHPILVTKGSTVTMTFDAPGITLTAVGRAMSEGGIGDSVTVLNPASYRQISAVVTGPGMVRAESAIAIPGMHARVANARP
jgi:flagella basal body P-ring formation protein FlgA